MVKREREIETTVKNICLEEEAKTNIYEDKQLDENIPIDQLVNYDNCAIIYSNGNTEHETELNDDIITGPGNKTNLNGELDEIIRLHDFVPMAGQKKRYPITRVHFTHEGKDIYLEVDPNDQHKMTWKDIKTLRDKMQITFQNQAFGDCVGQLKEKCMNQKNSKTYFLLKQKDKHYLTNLIKCVLVVI